MSWFTNKGQVLQLGAAVIFGGFAVAIGLFGGAAVLAALVGMTQKVMGLPVDWWILLSVFIGGLLLMWWSKTLTGRSPVGPGPGISSLPLKPNQMIYPYPSKNGVLWEWDTVAAELTGPFCPTHRVRLLFWPNHHGVRRVEFKDDDFLSGTGSFVCPRDDEEFIFIRDGISRVRDLRVQALARFQVEQEHRKKQSGT